MAMPAKSSRIDVRVSDETKHVIERAAALRGQSVSQYVVSTVQSSAHQVIAEHDIITLSVRDSQMLMDALDNPVPAGPQLRKVAARYKATKGQ